MAGKRGNKEGSIYQRKSDGRWAAALTLPDGRRKVLYRVTRAEAAEVLVRWQHNASLGMLPSGEGERLSVASYLELWLASLRTRQLAENTERNYREAVRTALAALPRLRRLKLTSLTAAHLDQLYGARLDAGAAPGAVRLIHATLHDALADAVRQHLIPRNVADLARLPRIHHEEMTVLPPEQARRLLATALDAGDCQQALWAVALATGMRRGELLGLRWRDVDLERGSLSVQHTLLYRNVTTWRLATPKTKASRGASCSARRPSQRCGVSAHANSKSG
jgi:integrase